MTISYPLSLPATPERDHFRRVTLRMQQRVGVVESPFTLATQVQLHQGERWAAAVEVKTKTRANVEAWLSFLSQLRGRYGTFLLGDPFGYALRGTGAGSPAVDGAAQTGTSIDLKGFTNGATGVLLDGDYFQVGSGAQTRLHKVQGDVDADGSGLATVDIWPRLRESPSDSEALVVSNARGTFRLALDDAQWEETAGGFYFLGFEAVEAI